MELSPHPLKQKKAVVKFESREETLAFAYHAPMFSVPNMEAAVLIGRWASPTREFPWKTEVSHHRLATVAGELLTHSLLFHETHVDREGEKEVLSAIQAYFESINQPSQEDQVPEPIN